MATYSINEAKTNFETLVALVEAGEQAVITRDGKPVARLAAIQKPKKRVLGCYFIKFETDLLEPTDPDHRRVASQFESPHKDPFDRMIAAQSFLEGLPVMSKDSHLDEFPIMRIW